jgi:hypothetical protein
MCPGVFWKAVRGQLRIFILFLWAFLGLPKAGYSEINQTYSPFVFDPDYPDVLFLVGGIDGRTALNFERAIEKNGVPRVLVLSSDGGFVNQALLIARRVRALHIDTLVPEAGSCYSACSLIFFAGVVRSAEGELGVHQISAETGDLVSGQVSISDILETLGGFDVPNQLLVDMFRTPPDEMYILSDAEKVEYSMIISTPSQPSAAPSLETGAFDFVVGYNATWSLPNRISVPNVINMYASEVDFYGKTVSRGAIAEDKLKFADRWPERRYRVVGDTVSVSCDRQHCFVRGDVDWEARNSLQNSFASGLAYFEMKLVPDGNTFKIISEQGHVVQRN